MMMPDRIPDDPKRNRARARSLISRVHQDRLQAAGHPEDVPLADKLTRLLVRIMDHPENKENWGSDINTHYPAGTTIKLVGVSKDGVYRPPQEVSMRKPSDFLDILEHYIDVGDVSEDLPPPYNPSSAPAEIVTIGDHQVQEDDDIDDPDAPWNQQTAEEAAEEANADVKSIKANALVATDFEHVMALRLSARNQFDQFMRNHGVLKILDDKAAEIIRNEIASADDQEKFAVAEAHIGDFDFDDKTIPDRLRHILDEKRKAPELQPEPFYPTPTNLEIRASKANSLEALKEVIAEVESTMANAEPERVNMRKTIDTYARKVILDDAKKDRSLPKLAEVLKGALNFPFFDKNYALSVVDTIMMRAKYFALATIWHGNEDDLKVVEQNLSKFTFEGDNTRLIEAEIAKRRKTLALRRRKAEKK